MEGDVKRSSFIALIGILASVLLSACPGSDVRQPDTSAGGKDTNVSGDGPVTVADGPSVTADTIGPAEDTGPASDGAGGNTITGTINGKPFPVSKSHWIGLPDPGSPPTIFLLLEPALTCSDISQPLWDKPLGGEQVLEIAVDGTTAKAYQIGVDAIANYLSGTFNPDASGGTVTVTAITASQKITGTFQLQFGNDTLSGAFDAPYCASGVEP